MAVLRLGTPVRNAMATAWGAQANGGTIQIRSGTMPATPETAATGTLLATLTFSATAFGAPSTGTVTAAAITGDTSADATGTAAWFRVLSSGAVAQWDGDVTVTGGGGAITLDSVSLVQGGAVNLTSLTLAQPQS